MNNLDNLQIIKSLDKSNLLGSVKQLAGQCQQTWDELKTLNVPPVYQRVDKIVVNGMGGSRLGARVAERLFSQQLKVPLIPIGSYTLPSFVDSKTLLILSSYSGTTEEILTSYEEAVKRRAKIMVLAMGGKLSEIAQSREYPGYFFFSPKYNPSGQPRMSLGYQVLGIILLLAKCKLLKVSEKEILQVIRFLTNYVNKFDVGIKTSRNPAKKLTQQLHNKIPTLVAAEFLMGATHVWRNQINENAKQLALYFEIPELNHHLLEGLRFPASNKNNLSFLFLDSDLYQPRNIKRFQITKKVLEGYKIPYQSLKLTGESKLTQVFELIQFGSWVSFYLAIQNNLDPTPIPWVDFFKKSLESTAAHAKI